MIARYINVHLIIIIIIIIIIIKIKSVYERMNRKCPPGTRFYKFQAATPTLFPQTPHPQHFGILLIDHIFVDHVTVLFMLM